MCIYEQNIFVGGFYYERSYGSDITNSCLQYDTKQVNCKGNSWKEVAVMKEARYYAACAVFQGNIIVSGGMDNGRNILSTVESYDVFADKWSSMPSMIRGKHDLSLSVVQDKLFVIGQGRQFCEVFDNIGKQFVALESSFCIYFSVNKSIALGNKIIVIQDSVCRAICYDVVDNKWSYELCEIIENYKFSSVKLPLY